MVPFLPLYPFFSEGAPKLAIIIHQGGGRQRSYGKTKCEDPITFWNALPWHFAVKCHFQVVFPTTHLSVYVSCRLFANPPWRTHGHYWGSEKLGGLFSLRSCTPPSLNQLRSPGRRFLPSSPLPGLISLGCGCSQRDAESAAAAAAPLLQRVLPPDTASPGASLAGWRLFTFLETGREEEPERWEA